MNDTPHSFTKRIINWYSIAKRDLPWRNTRDPFKIWLSEIILQQTRVDQGMPYYHRFVSAFPTVHDLAAASEQDVLKLWEGLGYYSRARNLHKTAKIVSEKWDGTFPDNYQGLIQLPGIGPYTAAAIASIAFDETVPVIDGNVFRFVSRFFGIQVDINDPKNRKHFEKILLELIPHSDPASFNQAMMEFGATICKPSPTCDVCHLNQECFARKSNRISSLPLKLGKVKVKEIFMSYIIFENEQGVLMRQRKDQIWTGLFEFLLLENDQKHNPYVVQNLLKPFQLQINNQSGSIKHLLTHRKLWVEFIHVIVDGKTTLSHLAKELEMTYFSWEEVLTLPRPKVIVNYLDQAGI